MAYTDPVSGKRGWRMTTIGKQFGTHVKLGQDAGQEQQQWSPDSKRLAFNLECNNGYPKGIYVMEVESGAIKYLAPTGNGIYTGNSSFNNANPNEILYFFAQKGSSPETSHLEVRAVNISTAASRLIASYQGAFDGSMLTQSADGKWIGFVAMSGSVTAKYHEPGFLAQNVVVNQQTGRDHPKWTFSNNPSENGAIQIMQQRADAFYWNPVHASKVWARRWNGNSWIKVYADVETGAEIKHNFGTAHSGLHPNGELIIGDYGIHDAENHCLTPRCGQGTPYRTKMHAFVDPSARSKGWEAEVVMDGYSNGLIYRLTFADVRDRTFEQNAAIASNIVGTSFGTTGGPAPIKRALHPHIQYSPNGRYLAWMTNIAGPQKAQAPGPNDGNARTGDIFVLDLQ